MRWTYDKSAKVDDLLVFREVKYFEFESLGAFILVESSNTEKTLTRTEATSHIMERTDENDPITRMDG